LNIIEEYDLIYIYMYIIIEIIFIVRYSTSNRESRKNITIKIKKRKNI